MNDIIINFLFSSIECAIVLGFVGSMFNFKVPKIYGITLFIFFCFIGSLFINMLRVNDFIYWIVLIAIFSLFCKCLYKGALFIKTFYLLFACFLLNASEMILTNIIIILPDTYLDKIMTGSLSQLIISILIKMFVIILGFFLNHYFVKMQLKLPVLYWQLADILLIIFIEVMSLAMYIEGVIYNSSEKYLGYAIVMNIGIMIMCVFMIFFMKKMCIIYEMKNEMELNELKANRLEKVLSVQEHTAEELKKVRHNINYNLANISYLIQNNKIDESVKYISNISEVLEGTKNVISCGNYIIDAILNYNIALCRMQDIDIDIVIDSIEEIEVVPVDISAILDNLIGNAIEAVTRMSGDNRYIDIKIFLYKGNLSIKIENTYDGRMDIEGNEIKSIKEDKYNHGYGIKSVIDTVEKNGGIVKFHISDNKYKAVVILPIVSL